MGLIEYGMILLLRYGNGAYIGSVLRVYWGGSNNVDLMLVHVYDVGPT